MNAGIRKLAWFVLATSALYQLQARAFKGDELVGSWSVIIWSAFGVALLALAITSDSFTRLASSQLRYGPISLSMA